MRTKSLLLTIFALFAFASVFAQDRIIKKNGEIIEAKVSVINQDNIVFKRFDNLDGPEYSIPKADVARIKYPNGTEDIFEDGNDQIGIKKRDWGKLNKNGMHNENGVCKNIISIIPLAFTSDGDGFGLSIEHALDKEGVIDFYMPVMVSFRRDYDDLNNTYTTYNMTYINPGIKIYTNLNSRKKMKFSIGPSVLLGVGNGNLTEEDPSTGAFTSGTQTRLILGTMGNIGFNFFPSAHVYFGIDYGLGFCFVNNYGGVNEGLTSVEDLFIKIGYRF